jgi:UDP-glucose 4-epimerase
MGIDLSSAKIMVTGAAGSLGSYVVGQLARAGAQVAAVDMRPAAAAWTAGEDGPVSYIRGDVRDPGTWSQALAGCDAVVHTAAILTGGAAADPVASFEVNTAATVRLLEASARAGVSRFILTSSGSVYGRREHGSAALREDSPLRGRSFYAVSKIASEMYLEAFAAAGPLECTALRFAAIYGLGAGRSGALVPYLLTVLDDIDHHRVPVVPAHRAGARDLIYVRDAAAAVACALRAETSNIAVNIGSGQTTTNAELFAELCALYGYRGTVSWDEPAGQPAADSRCYDVSLARNLIGFSAATGLREGLQWLIGWHRRGHPADEAWQD